MKSPYLGRRARARYVVSRLRSSTAIWAAGVLALLFTGWQIVDRVRHGPGASEKAVGDVGQTVDGVERKVDEILRAPGVMGREFGRLEEQRPRSAPSPATVLGDKYPLGYGLIVGEQGRLVYDFKPGGMTVDWAGTAARIDRGTLMLSLPREIRGTRNGVTVTIAPLGDVRFALPLRTGFIQPLYTDAYTVYFEVLDAAQPTVAVGFVAGDKRKDAR
jgi:hypothetical protein